MRRRPPRSTLLPYTTLCRSRRVAERLEGSGPFGCGRGRGAASDRAHLGRRRRSAHRPTAAPKAARVAPPTAELRGADRKSTRLNSSHANIPYAVFFLIKKL